MEAQLVAVSEFLLWAVVILGSAYAGYLIGRWSVLGDGYDDGLEAATGAPYRDYAGEQFSEATAPMPRGPATVRNDSWQPKKPITRSAKPPPALAGNPGSSSGGGSGGGTGTGARRKPSPSATRPPAAAGLKSPG